VAEEQDNMVLHLLREMRGDMQAMRQEMAQRFTKLDREFGELREASVLAAGWAGLAKAAADHNGETMDAIRLELDDVQARLAALETKA
jgi:hypothetical protein